MERQSAKRSRHPSDHRDCDIPSYVREQRNSSASMCDREGHRGAKQYRSDHCVPISKHAFINSALSGRFREYEYPKNQTNLHPATESYANSFQMDHTYKAYSDLREKIQPKSAASHPAAVVSMPSTRHYTPSAKSYQDKYGSGNAEMPIQMLKYTQNFDSRESARVFTDGARHNGGYRQHPSGHSSKHDKHKKQYNKVKQIMRRRRWEYSSYSNHRHRPLGIKFKVMSFNILAQGLLEDHMDLYRKSHHSDLRWTSRWKKLKQELEYHGAEIICLQEVEECVFEKQLKPTLEGKGYTGHFIVRTGNKEDGCAIFYKTSKFALDQCLPLSYYRKGMQYLDRDNVALMLRLNPIVNGKEDEDTKLVVATTHLLFNPRRGDVKLAQTALLLAELHRCSMKDPLTNERYPVILCGDFNSEPFSPLYAFLCKGQLQYEGIQRSFISGQAEGGMNQTAPIPKKLLDKKLGISDHCELREAYDLCKKAWLKSNGLEDTASECPSQEGTNEDTASECPSEEGTKEDTGSECPFREGTKEDWDAEIEQASQVRENCTEDTPCGSNDTHRTNGECSENSSSQKSPENPNDTSLTFRPFMQGSGTLMHSLNLTSVYGHFGDSDNDQDKYVTTCHNRAGCTVDYIFYSTREPMPLDFTVEQARQLDMGDIPEGQLKLLGRHKLLTAKECRDAGELPNCLAPSDHLPLLASFYLEI